MPTAPLRPCAEAGCSALVVKGRCPTHTQVQEARRGSRIARGYDAAYLKLRAWFVQQPENQLCVMCTKEGRVTLMAEVDHVRPFRGLQDPLRLDPKNLQGLCIYHHRQKHAGVP